MAGIVELNFDVQGPNNAKDMVILHGLFGSSSNWRSIAKHFANEFRVFSLDLRNHGQSPWADEMDYDLMAADIDAFIVKNGLTSPHIIGHSMGGKTLMSVLQHGKSTLNISFVIDIAPVSYKHNHDALLLAMKSLDLSVFKSRKEIDAHLESKIEQLALRKFLMQNLVRQGTEYQWRLNLKSIQRNIDYIYDYKIKNTIFDKVIFIRGELSDYLAEKYHDQLFRLFPNAVLETIKNTGHWLHAEKPEELKKIIQKYI